MLDPTQQRVISVLIEKELSVPESYPMTENALLAGCNQKSNRDPVLSLESFELHGALLALRDDGWIVRIDGGRSTKYRHCVEERLNLHDDGEKAVLAELLLRGPQAPGELARRAARMGSRFDADRARAVLDQLAARTPRPLVEELPHRPRERDRRWEHRLGEHSTAHDEEGMPHRADVQAPLPAPTTPPPPDLGTRVESLEFELRELRRRVDELTGD